MIERHHPRSTQTKQPSLGPRNGSVDQFRRLLASLAIVGCLIVTLFLGPRQALAGMAKAKQFASSAMKQFHQRKYMAAVRLHGQAIGELPDNAYADRARSLFYIGLCYHRLKYKSYAVGAWKRFLKEIKNVPNAAQNKDWAIKIRLAQQVISQKSAPAPRKGAPSDNSQPSDPGTKQPDPPPAGRAAPRDQVPPNNHSVSTLPKSKTTPLWLSNVRRCLRYRAGNAKAASRRLRYCRDRMPTGAQCTARCRTVKQKISLKIQQLERPNNNDNADGSRDQWLDQPGNSSGNGAYDGRSSGNDYDNRSGYTRRRYSRKPRRSPMYAIATTTSLIGVGVGLLGLGFWIYSGSLVSDRNSLMSGKPSPANTSAIIQKHDLAQGMQVAALVSFSAAGAAVLLGSLMFTIARRTSYSRVSRRNLPPAANKRAVVQAPGQKGSANAVTLFSTGLQP